MSDFTELPVTGFVKTKTAVYTRKQNPRYSRPWRVNSLREAS